MSWVPWISSHCQAGVYRPGHCPTCPCPHVSQNVLRHHSFQCPTQGHQSLISSSVPSTHFLNISSDSPTTLGSLCQCLTILLVKEFSLIPNLQLPLRQNPLVLSHVAWKKRQTPTSLQTPYITKYLESSWLQDSF